MIYDVVIIGTDFVQENMELLQKERGGNVFFLEQKSDYLNGIQMSYNYYKGADCEVCITHGVLLGITQESFGFELQIHLSRHHMVTIHSKQIIITTYESMKDNSIISLYEVLWAAGVQLCERTLYPQTDNNNETSTRGIFYSIPMLC